MTLRNHFDIVLACQESAEHRDDRTPETERVRSFTGAPFGGLGKGGPPAARFGSGHSHPSGRFSLAGSWLVPVQESGLGIQMCSFFSKLHLPGYTQSSAVRVQTGVCSQWH